MATIWRDNELSLSGLIGRTVGIIGYGAQGRAHAMNLRDSGVSIEIGLRRGQSWERADADGFAPVTIGQAAMADVVALMLPESSQAEVLQTHINPVAKPRATLLFAHGYTVLYRPECLRSDLQRLLVAPKAIGPRLRTLYESGLGAAALVAAEPGDLELAKSYAFALGCGRAAVIHSSFRAETETDLFGEQAVLCGGMPSLAIAAFETLVNAGYDPEVAYFECLYEIKLIADLMVERGIAGMVESISDTAKYGAMTAGPKIVTESTRAAMRDILVEIQSGKFATGWESEQREGTKTLDSWLSQLRSLAIDAAGGRIAK